MPKSRKDRLARNFEADIDTQLAGLRLVRSQRIPAPRADEIAGDLSEEGPANRAAGIEVQAVESEVLSKLIKRIRSI